MLDQTSQQPLSIIFTPQTYTYATRQKQDEAAQTMGNFMAQVMWAEKERKNTGEKAKASSPVLFKSFYAFRCVGHGVGQSFFKIWAKDTPSVTVTHRFS